MKSGWLEKGRFMVRSTDCKRLMSWEEEWEAQAVWQSVKKQCVGIFKAQ